PTAKHLIVPVPPAMTAGIDFEPALPPERAQLIQRAPLGAVCKVHVVYDRPFWRDEGLTGQAVADTPPCHITFDNSLPGDRRGILMGFVEAQAARDWMRLTREQRRDSVIENFTTYFGPAARQARGYLEQLWPAARWS